MCAQPIRARRRRGLGGADQSQRRGGAAWALLKAAPGVGGPRAQPKMSASHDSRCDSGGGRGGGAELGLGRAKRPRRGGGRVAISRSDRVFLRGTARIFPFLSEISFPSAFPAVLGAVFRAFFPVFRRSPRVFFHSRFPSPPIPRPRGLRCSRASIVPACAVTSRAA